MDLFLAKYKITFTHKETGAVIVHYFEELKMGTMIDFVASQIQEAEAEEYEVCVEFIDKAVAHFE